MVRGSSASCKASLATLVVLWLAAPRVLAETVVDINGLHSNSEGACSQATIQFVGEDCTYTAQRPAEAPLGWAGPSFGGAYYAPGSTGDNPAYVPVAGDARVQPAISGTLTFTGPGPGATIAGTIIVGPAVRNTVVGNGTRGVERWDAITHTLDAVVVDAANPNANGGFDYVIGSRGQPGALCQTAAPAVCFIAETGPDGFGGGVGFWNGGVAPAVGIERSTVTGGPAPNLGATTTGVITNYSSSCQNPTDCATGRLVWQASTPGPNTEDPGWDNLIMVIATDAAGNVTSGEGWWTQEYALLGPATTPRNSWAAGRFSFSGAARGAAAACPDFSATVEGGSTGNVIDARSRCTGFATGPVISIVAAPASGTAVVNAAGNIEYTPDAGFSGTDSLTYRGSGGVAQDDGVITLLVSADRVPSIADAILDTAAGTTVTLAVTLGTGAAAEHTLAVVTGGSSGACTAAITGGGAFTVSYAPDPLFVGQDSCTVRVTDANGDAATAIVSITVPDERVVAVTGGGSGAGPWLLALLGIVAARRRRWLAWPLMAAVGWLAVSVDAVAAPPGRAYLGVGVTGSSLSSDEQPGTTLGIAGEGIGGSFSDFVPGGELHAGWFWSDVAGVELRYAGTADGTSVLRSTSLITGDTTTLGEVEASLSGYTLYVARLVPGLPLPAGVTVYGKAGWTWQKVDVDFAPGPVDDPLPPASGSARDNGLAVALGARWHFARRWAATLEGESLWVDFDAAYDEPWRVGVALEYWFGGKTR